MFMLTKLKLTFRVISDVIKVNNSLCRTTFDCSYNFQSSWLTLLVHISWRFFL